MASTQVHKLSLPGVACQSTLLLFICLLLSCSHPEPCECSGSGGDHDQQEVLTLSTAFDQMPGYLSVFGLYPCNDNDTVWGGLGTYMQAYHSELDLSRKGMFSPFFTVHPLGDGRTYPSFSIFFTMSIYQTEEEFRLVFVIKPASLGEYESYVALMDMSVNRSFLIPSSPASQNISGSHVSAQISTLESISSAILIDIGITELAANNVSSEDKKYSLWVDYNHNEHRMLVYAVEGDGTSKPTNAIASAILSAILRTLNWSRESASFAFFSSMGQLLQLHTWNSTTVRHQPQFCTLVDSGIGGKINHWAIALSSVLGTVAAAAVIATVVYMNSKYRRWKTEQERLVEIMQRLPGVPTQVDYTEIRKATKNFHDTMKLGKGGFGAVYRCTLPPSASRTGQATLVAVKKFVREVEHRRFDDFLAEVSIINRLRHKNIVPLIGWSYNKGEPILVYEYMMNGSLDQHLFLKGQQQQQQEETSIVKWQTRYNIAKDIAIGLHYVHHEHEPMVLHRDIKASNIMLDTAFRARLGDFGIASTVAIDRSSVTGIAGTWGYIAPEYTITYRSTRQTDTYAFGVLILEIVTGKKNGDVPPEDDHITDWVWRLHQEGKLLESMDATVLKASNDHDHKDDSIEEEAHRLLLLGLACTNPNPYNRPCLAEVVQVITKLVPPLDVPLERPTFMWPPEDWRCRNSVYSTAVSTCDASSTITVQLGQVIQDQEQPPSAAAGEHSYVDSILESGR